MEKKLRAFLMWARPLGQRFQHFHLQFGKSPRKHRRRPNIRPPQALRENQALLKYMCCVAAFSRKK